jgi:predicted DCC family thiol-disulfide oxidoreductase YuxK
VPQGQKQTIGRAAVRAGHISFRDINDEPAAFTACGASLDDVRRRLHATDETGRLIVGTNVMIAIWLITPGEGWLASLFGNLVMRPVTRFGYDRFADLLFAWNRWKGIGECADRSEWPRPGPTLR